MRHFARGQRTSLEAARRFAGADGVVVKIDVQSGRDICPLSCFPTEDEILLSPNHKFVVQSATGGYVDGEHTFIDLLQMEGDWLRS